MSRSQGHSAAGKIKSMKNLSHAIRNRTREPPPLRAVPPPTASLRTPKNCNADSLVIYEGRSKNIILKLKSLGISRIESAPNDGQSDAIPRRSHV